MKPYPQVTSGTLILNGNITANQAEAKKELQQVQQKVRNVGQKTFYNRNNQWVDAAASTEQEQKPTKVKRFSKSCLKAASLRLRTAEMRASSSRVEKVFGR